ncbi:hypothetical protein NPIL_465441 [Nephila pilipes]|uniref:Uncharacterized protein n=1 Tax=Nephila pilipes TaxID=299642 RepID=A0A8X6MS77_NEPPI|nr:hypothetical protein NPIL_465441 [Nephila pilipes]
MHPTVRPLGGLDPPATQRRCSILSPVFQLTCTSLKFVTIFLGPSLFPLSFCRIPQMSFGARADISAYRNGAQPRLAPHYNDSSDMSDCLVSRERGGNVFENDDIAFAMLRPYVRGRGGIVREKLFCSVAF